MAKLNILDRQFAEMIVDMWTSFAIDGVPRVIKKRRRTDEPNEAILIDWIPFAGKFFRVKLW